MYSNRSVSYQPLKNHKKTYHIKDHLSELAIKIKVGMDENQILMDSINNICVNIKRSKQMLKKFTSLQNKENIETELFKNNTNLKSVNKNLAIKRKLLFQKYIRLKNKYSNELEPLNTELNILSDRKFIIENIAQRRDYEIEKITKECNDSSDAFSREEKREIISNNLDMDEDLIIFELEKNQTLLLNKLKEYNKIINKCKELNYNINNYKNATKKVKEGNIEDLTDEEKNIIFKQNKKKEEYQSIINSVEEDSILNDTINSEYEDDENIEFQPLPNNYCPIKLDNKFMIPKINLVQIEYNKRKFKQEDAEKSLSREIKNYDDEDIKIKEIKNKLKKIKNKNQKYQKKCANFEKKFKMMKKIINNMTKYNYGISVSSSRNKEKILDNRLSFGGVDKIGNNTGYVCGRQQMNSYRLRDNSINFRNKYYTKNLNEIDDEFSF